MDFYGFQRTSSVLSHNPKIIDHLTNSAHFILFRWVSLLKLKRYFFISRCQISVIMAIIYGRKCRRHL